MIRWIIESSLRLRLPVLVFALALFAVGMWQLPDAPKEVLPEFAPTYVEIQTEALGLSADEVEQLITVPMEQDLLNGVAWLDEIRSESVTGLSSIVLIFEPGTDPLQARQMVQERLTAAHALPNVSKPPTMLQPLSSASRVIMVRLSSAELTPIQMSVLARWTIRPGLMGVPGVANVSVWGQRERQLQVQVDPQLLDQQGVTLDQVVSTTGNALWVSPLSYLEASWPSTGGFIDTPQQRLGVQHIFPIGSPDELAQVPIEGCATSYGAETAGATSACPTLGDIATIAEDHQPMIGDAVSAESQGLLLVIEKFPDANTADVTSGVQDKLELLQPGLTGLVIDSTIFQRANLIDAVIDNLNNGLLLGILLAILVLFALSFNWRTALTCAVAIPLSLVAAALVLHLRGETFNSVVIAGLLIALAVIIDDVVSDMDNVFHRLRQHRGSGSDKPTVGVITDALLEVRSLGAAATVIILLTALPVLFLGGLFDSFFLGGQSRAFFQPLVVSYALAVIASMVVALVVTPTLAALLYSRVSAQTRTSPVSNWLQRHYARLLERAAPQFGLALAAVAVAVIAGLIILPQLRQPDSIVPASKDRDLLISWETAPGTSLPEIHRVTSRISDELRGIPGVRNVGAHVGRALTSDQVVDVNSGELWVSIQPSANYGNTVAAVEEIVQGYPGIGHTVSTYLEERVNEAGVTQDDVVLRIFGEDPAVLRQSAEAAQLVLSDIDGVASSQVKLQFDSPEIQVEVDLAKAQQLGLVPGDVRRAAGTLVTGLEVGSLFEEQKVFEVIVLGIPTVRQSLTSIENLPIDTPDGGQVRLGDVASVQITSAPDVIKHDSVSRYIDVTATVSGRDVSAVVDDLNGQLASLTFPLEYHAEVLGEYSERQDARQLLYAIAIAAAIGVFLIMQALFNSWSLAAVSFLTLPAALVGGLAATWIDDGVVTIGTLAGMLALLAVAIRNGIMLVTRYQRLEQHEGAHFGRDLILRGAQERLAPIVMTAFATAAAVLPFVIAGSAPGLEIVHPMAVAILGGLISSTMLSLFVIPVLYLRFAPSSRSRPVDTQMFGIPVASAPAD